MPDDKELSFPFVNRKMLDFDHSAVFTLLVNTVSATVVATSLTIQGMTKYGVFKYSCGITATGGKQSFTFNLPDIPIFLSVIQEDTSFGPNNVYVMVKLRINNDVAVILTQGYANENSSLSWPSQEVVDPMSKMGALSTIAANNPAAGAEWTRTVGSYQYWEILALHFTLTTSADVANRRPAIKIAGVATTYLTIPTPATITASKAYKINCYKGAIGTDDQIGLIQTVPLPDKLVLGPGAVISTVTTGIQAADQYSDILFTANIFYI